MSDPTAWEELPSGPASQGLALVAYDGKIYRIGGMQPRNQPGEKADNHSMTTCQRYDPESKKWEALPAKRRTVYGFIDRNDLLALFRIFDFANPDITTAQRDATAVPQQALFFLNSPFVMEQACKMINRPAFQRLDDETKRVRYLYQRVYQRDPSANEIQRGLRFLQAKSAATDLKEQQPLTPWERYGQVLLMSNELMFVD